MLPFSYNIHFIRIFLERRFGGGTGRRLLAHSLPFDHDFSRFRPENGHDLKCPINACPRPAFGPSSYRVFVVFYMRFTHVFTAFLVFPRLAATLPLSIRNIRYRSINIRYQQLYFFPAPEFHCPRSESAHFIPARGAERPRKNGTLPRRDGPAICAITRRPGIFASAPKPHALPVGEQCLDSSLGTSLTASPHPAG